MKKQSITDSVLQLFAHKDVSLQMSEITKGVGIKTGSNSYFILLEVLQELLEQGILTKPSRRKYELVDSASSEIVGVLRIKDDRGIVESNLPHISKIIIKRKNMFTAFDGDTVVVRLLASKKDKKYQGEVIRIAQRQERNIVGRIEFDGSFFFLVPDDNQYIIDFLVPKDKLMEATPGDKVHARFLSWDNPHISPQAEVLDVMGQSGNPAVEFDGILREFNLIPHFSDAVMKEAKESAKKVSNSEIARRLDLRNKEIITIDPIDAKDFDDALSLETLDNGNLLLGVHIADVSHYVKERTELDIEALKRGNSTYLVDQVIPMLPEELSNDMCSLKPNRVRLAYTVLMELDSDLNVVNYQILETVIKSVKRFAYEQVQDIIDSGKGLHLELIKGLHKLSEDLRTKRFAGGGIDFSTVEVRFKLDENRSPVEAMLKKSIPATQLVEECMLLANKTVAEHVKKISNTYKLKETLPFLYRVHAEPLPEKLRNSLEFIKMLGPKHNFEIKSSREINTLLEAFSGSPEEPIVNQILVRSMPKAEYSDENIGHYGLGFEDYSHFTSPIRRYPDLLIHRLLKEYNSEKPNSNRIKFIANQLNGLGEHCTARERVSMEAERASTKLAQTMLAKKNIGRTFNGTITGVMEFGIFVTMDEIHSEGMLHIKDIYDDYYIFDEKRMRIVGKRSKKIFQFGKRIRVKIVAANIDKRRIELDYITDVIKED